MYTNKGKEHHQYKHGQARTTLYKKWEAMKRRCLNKNEKSYERYGGRGITISPKWLDFQGFQKDMEESFVEGMSLERIDNNKGYSKQNCKWIPLAEQAKNKRSVILYEHNGKKMCITDWAKEYKLKPRTVRARIKYGWSLLEALETKVSYGNRYR